jgi:hypothetical protein
MRVPFVAFLPGLPGATVATYVLAGAAEREHHEPSGTAIDELSAH